MSYQRTFYYTLDTELRVIHAFRNCVDAKMAVKWNYVREVKVINVDTARELDDLTEHEKYKTCGTCFRRERQEMKKEGRTKARPGFLHPPAGYKPPPPRNRQTKRNVTRD